MIIYSYKYIRLFTINYGDFHFVYEHLSKFFLEIYSFNIFYDAFFKICLMEDSKNILIKEKNKIYLNLYLEILY